MGLLDVEVEGPRHGVVAGGDGLELGCDAVNEGALELVHVLVEEAEPEDPERVRVGLELLHDEVVVLARLDVGAVLADGVADRLVGLLVLLLHRLDEVEGLAAALEAELGEGVAGAGGRGRAEDHDLAIRKRVVHVLPGLVGIRDQLLAARRVRNLAGEGEEDVATADFHHVRLPGVREHDAVVADLDLDDVGDAVLVAAVHLGLLDAPRGVGDVGVVDTDPGAEELEPTARAGGLDRGGLEFRALPELLRDDGGERIDGRRADDADVVAGLGVGNLYRGGERERGDGSPDEDSIHVRVSPMWLGVCRNEWTTDGINSRRATFVGPSCCRNVTGRARSRVGSPPGSLVGRISEA